MNLENLEQQVILWTKAAIVVPILFTILLLLTWYFEFLDLNSLFFLACGSYFGVAIIWWWWTMQSVRLLIKTLQDTKQGVINVAIELKNIREELVIDNNKNK